MAKVVDAIVTQITENGDGFAIREDNDELIYISKATTHRMNLEIADEIIAIIVENKVRPDATPWFAIRVREHDQDEETEGA